MPTSEQLALAKKIKVERERGKSDLYYLANDICGYNFQPDVHAELFACFPKYDADKPLLFLSEAKRTLVLWPRGHYKSTAITVLILWFILCYPDIRLVIMRSTKEATEEWLGEILAHYTGEAAGSRFRELYPEYCGEKADLRATKSRFTVPNRVRKQLREATVTVASQKSNTTGKHFDVGMFDDLVTQQNFQNPKVLDKVATAFYGMIPVMESGGYMFVTGTRYAHGDLYEQIIRKNTNNAWTVTVKTCWTDDGKDVRFPRRMVPGKPEPIGFTREQLLQIMHEDPAMFASQYLLQPASTANALFSKDGLAAQVIHPDMAPALSQAVLFVDQASGLGERSDDRVILCGKFDPQGRQYVVDCVGGQWTTHQFANQLIHMALKHRPSKIMLEKTASAQIFLDFVNMVSRERGVMLPMEFLKCDVRLDAKYMRISALDSMFRRNRLFFFAGLPVWEKMVEQFLKFPGGKNTHDDYPDTVALMSQFFGINVQNVIPLSEQRNVLVHAIEAQSIEVMPMMLQEETPSEGGMGDDFAF